MGASNDQWQDFGQEALSAYADDWKVSPVLYEEVVEPENNSYDDELGLPTPVTPLQTGMMFASFKEFQEMFQPWNIVLDHRFRIRSSHPFWNPDGTKDEAFQYRQITYHCAHYGEPRPRGRNPRPPRRGYKASGCGARLHLTFNRRHKALVITKMNIHFNHERSPCVQDGSAETSKTDLYTVFDFNEHQLQQLYDIDYAHTVDEGRSDEGVANLSCGQPDDITNEP